MKVSYTKNFKNSTYLRIHSIISILTEAYDYVKLTEAVPYSVAKEYLEIERSPEAEARVKSIFGKLKSLPNALQIDKRGYRISFPFNEDSTEFEIQSILEPYDFSIKDYKDGIALDTKNNREISLGKALNIVSKKESDAKELIDRYAAIKSKGAINKDSDLMIVFSSAKYDIIGMSTGRDSYWDSCMNVIKGSNRHYIKADIREGSIICYITRIGDTDLKKPLGRVLIKPYLNSENPKDVILYAEYKTYGSIPNPEKFIDEVDDYMEKTQKLSGSYKRLECLYGDSERNSVENKETIQKRALNNVKEGISLTSMEFVSLPLKNKKIYIDELNKEEKRLSKVIYSFATQSQKKFYIRRRLKNEEEIEDYEFKLAPKELKYEIIDYKLKNYVGSIYHYEFEAATTEQRDRYIDKQIAKKFIDIPESYLQELSDKQQKFYIERVLEKGKKYFSNFEIRLMSEEQFLKFISNLYKNNEFIYQDTADNLSGRNMEILVDYLIENDIHEIRDRSSRYDLTEKQIEKYINKLIETDQYEELASENNLRKASKKDQERYIDYLLSKEISIPDWIIEYGNPKQKKTYINSKDSEGYRLENEDFIHLTQNEIDEYINRRIKIGYSLAKYEFEAISSELKEKYIDYKIENNKESLKDYELEAAAPEKIKKHIINLLDKSEQISKFELKYATPEQIKKYINLKLSNKSTLYLYEYEFELASLEQKEKYINYKIEDNKSLKDYEFQAATPEQKERYIDTWIGYEEKLSEYELEFATPEQKERYKEYAKD